ncbi:MAG: hypothetical protein HYR88_09935 [Verrucomicrobia bacterium]|nr:hypothetical protein [Verrucomicrobiota bacterium]MBI3867119.1 hypothetical protein [Verrucomicrobiota bacterium]
MRRALTHLPLLIAVAALVAMTESVAHEGPEVDIQELTDAIKATGETADLLLQRAIEYRVLGKMSEALRDLEEAARLESYGLPISRELAKVQFGLGKTNEAIDTVTKAVGGKSLEATDRANLLILRSGFYQARSEYKKSIEDANQAIQLYDLNPEWYLQRSALQLAANLPKERLAGIEAGIGRTGAGVLDVEKIEALLDDKQFSAALPLIDKEIESSRIRSSWLIRRAKAHFGLGSNDRARADLKEAFDEIQPRIQLAAPDVSLLIDRATIHELLGEKELARTSYELARDAGAEAWVKEKIKTLKAEIDKEHAAATSKKSAEAQRSPEQK